jgi:ABC-type phosphate/phosphonate transport system substrate-binding protein
MLGDSAEEILPRIRLLHVPKDIDALMAVSFGIANAAIGSEHASAALFKANPLQQNNLRMVGQSKPYLLPLIVAPEAKRDEYEPIIAVLLTMAKDPKGQLLLRMMGFDAFQLIDMARAEEFMP